MKKLEYLQTENMHKPYIFDQVVVSANGTPALCILGKCFSEFKSGPNLRTLANAAGELMGFGFYGLESARPIKG